MNREPSEIVLLLLPGLDGTGELFSWLIAALPPQLRPVVASLRGNDYAALAGEIEPILPRGRPFILLGESFSGPLALRLASRRPADLVAVVLVASFVSRPLGWMSALTSPFVHPYIFRRAASPFLLRRFLLGVQPPQGLIEATQRSLRSVDPATLAARCRVALTVDATDALERCPVPILYLAGTRDKLISSRVAARLKQLRPDLETAWIDAPHFLLQCAPEAAVRAILAFLARLRQTAR